MAPLLGFIRQEDRTPKQDAAHAAAMANMPRFSLPVPILSKGDKILLSDLWKHQLVVADVGFEFDRIHQLTGSCFVKGTQVQMADGTEKCIEAVEAGDTVISHTGQKRKVTRVFARWYSGTLHTFHLRGHRFPFTVTADHDVITVPASETSTWRWHPTEPIKKKAGDTEAGERMLLSFGMQEGEDVDFNLSGFLSDCVGIDEDDESLVRLDRHKGRQSLKVKKRIDLDEKLAWLLGLFVAEGTICRNVKDESPCGIILSLSAKERLIAEQAVEVIRSVFAEDVSVKIGHPAADKLNCLQVRVYSSIIARFFAKLVPGNVWSKRIPRYIFKSKRSVRLTFIRGWVDGDGQMQSCINYPYRKGLSLQGVSASEGLIRDMMRLSLSCGLKPSIARRKKMSHQRVASVDFFIHGRDALDVYPDKEPEFIAAGVKVRNSRTAKLKDGYAVEIERVDVSKVSNHLVYCCEVEIDHSLIVNSVAVGQCVWAGGTNGLFSTICAQRVASANPTKAFLPFTMHNYAISRHYMGDDGQGEGSLGSTFARSLNKDGVRDWIQGTDGMPSWTHQDGLTVTSRDEMQWSSYRNSNLSKVLQVSRNHLVGNAAECKTVQDIKAMILNGKGVSFACSKYIGNGSLRGNGDNVAIMGHWDGNGGHQQYVQGYWEHPDFGPLYNVGNNWPRDTYPVIPTQPVCSVWVKEDDVEQALGYYAEVFGLSNLDWFEALPNLLDYFI